MEAKIIKKKVRQIKNTPDGLPSFISYIEEIA
jgi:hypothetical protein